MSATATSSASPWTVTTTSRGEGDFAKPPAGNHPAVLVAIVDMGTQEDDYQGEKKESHRAYFVWELVSEKAPSGKNFVIGIDLTVSMHEKAKLRKWIEARLGRKLSDETPYVVSEELGKTCLLNVVMKNGYPRIEGLGPLPKGMTCPAPDYTPFAWTIADAKGGSITLPSWLPYFYGKPIGDTIRDCKELRGAGVQASTTAPAENAYTRAAAAPAAPAATPAAPARPQRGTPAVQYWVDYDGLVGDPPVMTEVEFKQWYTLERSKLSPMLCPVGGQDWKPCNVIFSELVPF